MQWTYRSQNIYHFTKGNREVKIIQRGTREWGEANGSVEDGNDESIIKVEEVGRDEGPRGGDDKEGRGKGIKEGGPTMTTK